MRFNLRRIVFFCLTFQDVGYEKKKLEKEEGKKDEIVS